MNAQATAITNADLQGDLQGVLYNTVRAIASDPDHPLEGAAKAELRRRNGLYDGCRMSPPAVARIDAEEAAQHRARVAQQAQADLHAACAMLAAYRDGTLSTADLNALHGRVKSGPYAGAGGAFLHSLLQDLLIGDVLRANTRLVEAQS